MMSDTIKETFFASSIPSEQAIMGIYVRVSPRIKYVALKLVSLSCNTRISELIFFQFNEGLQRACKWSNAHDAETFADENKCAQQQHQHAAARRTGIFPGVALVEIEKQITRWI